MAAYTKRRHFNPTIKGFEYFNNNRYDMYTGVKDKMGTDIYENDIVSWIINDNHAIIKVVNMKGIHEGEAYSWEDYQKLLGKSKVIGNVYKTPELVLNNNGAAHG